MDLRDYLNILRERWILVLACVLGGILAAGVFTLATTPSYQSTSQIYVSVQTQDGSTQGLAQGSTYSQSQVAGFADLATSPLVLDPVIQELGLDLTAAELAPRVAASVRLNTSLINITVTSEDPSEAAAFSDAIASTMSVVLPELQRPLDAAVSPVRITTTRTAAIPQDQASPDTKMNLALGLLLGLALGAGAAVLRTTLDTRMRSEADLAALSDRPFLGAIEFDTATPQDPLALISHPASQRAEAIRRLRTNLQFIDASSRPKSIVVTSSLPGEGKSTTAANLALAMADAGSRVVLIDADLRRPTLARVLGIEGGVGLTTLLIGRAEIGDVVQPFRETTLDVITSGQIPPNPSELLGSSQMRSLLDHLVAIYDLVILDSAPLLPVTDGALLAKLTGGALLVVGADTAHRQQVIEALSTLERVDARVLGVVLNRARPSQRGSYAYREYIAEEPKERKQK